MDSGSPDGSDAGERKPPALPADLPTSLDDRKEVRVSFVPETEMYDGWQGTSAAPRVHGLNCLATKRDELLTYGKANLSS